jgi:putative membrane protein
MRQHVLAGRQRRDVAAPAAAPADDVVLALTARDLMLCGLIQNKGLLLVSGLVGILWEFGLVESVTERFFGEGVPGRGVIRRVLLAMVGRGDLPIIPLIVAAGGFLLLLIALRLLSAVWALISLHGYTLVQQKDSLRAQFGLLTRMTATTPLGRIQCMTVEEGPLHRWLGRASIRVQTAGDTLGGDEKTPLREVVAPIIRIADVPRFLARLHPGCDMQALVWHAPHPRAFRRALVETVGAAIVFSSWLAFMLRWWWLPVAGLLIAWAIVHARMYVRHLRWGTGGASVALRAGWVWRRTTIAPYARIQAVSTTESPFDRRHEMAGVLVDTFGARTALLDIPYLGRSTARHLAERLAQEAAATPFRP